MAGSNALAGAFSALAKLAIIIAATSLCVMVLVLLWQVIGRYALNDSPGWTEPVALILMSVSALFGAAIAVRRESHFNFPTLVEAAPAPLRTALKVLSRLIALGFGAALAGYGGFLMLDSWSVPMAGAPAPEGLSYVGVCLGGGLIALFALERLMSGDPPEEAH
ncbi:TRAP transporter small permease [Terricaulis sp.]|uniref:TRAP transporter small permease n=1 Tax=Terricaulis sp. TaxID=2768686 RepID=UPI002AC4A63D|nr:TRAP transporter small permease [Terricaulis sp.]MDZ4691007.1 TRAP transporter small permease [Terricaulis sp.]